MGHKNGRNGEEEERRTRTGEERGAGTETMVEEECRGDDNMQMTRGAGGKSHSAVVYGGTEDTKDHARGEEGGEKQLHRFSHGPSTEILIH